MIPKKTKTIDLNGFFTQHVISNYVYIEQMFASTIGDVECVGKDF